MQLVSFLFSIFLVIACEVDNESSGSITEDVYTITPSEAAIRAAKSKKNNLNTEADRREMTDYVNLRASEIVKSAVMESGTIIDCIDMQSQRALKGKKLLLAPADIDESQNPDTATEDDNEDEKKAVLEGGGICEPGTIPRRRITIETLNKFGSMKNFYSKIAPQLVPAVPNSDVIAVHGHAAGDKWVSNHGSKAVLNLWNPYSASGDQFSLSQIWVSRGDGTNLQTVEAGWLEYRDRYGNWQPHLFIYYTPDAYDHGCFDLDCNAFVQTNSNVTIGGSWANFSVYNGTQYTISLQWYRDSSGNWWLKYGDTWVGYYPASLFDSAGIRNGAARVTYGGEVVWPWEGSWTATDMGSGYWPSYGWAKAAYTRTCQYRNSSGTWLNASSMSPIATYENCYDINLFTSTGSWGNYFYFGGPGINGSNCP